MTKDYYEEGRQEIERIFNSSFMSPQDLEEFAFGVKDWVDEYLGYKDPDEGIHTYVVGEDKIEPDPIANRVMLLQLADGLVKTYSDYDPNNPFSSVAPALKYWWREGVPSDPMGWVWLTKDEYYTNCGDAYNYIRENYLPQMPELDWVALM